MLFFSYSLFLTFVFYSRNLIFSFVLFSFSLLFHYYFSLPSGSFFSVFPFDSFSCMGDYTYLLRTHVTKALCYFQSRNMLWRLAFLRDSMAVGNGYGNRGRPRHSRLSLPRHHHQYPLFCRPPRSRNPPPEDYEHQAREAEAIGRTWAERVWRERDGKVDGERKLR